MGSTNPEATAAERLRIQDEALRFAQVGLYRYRFNGTVLDMNEAAFDILELRDRFSSPAEVRGKSIEDLIVYVGPRRRIRDLVQRGGEARNVLYPFRTLSGADKWALHDSFAVIDPDTGERVVQAIIKDVTEIHRAEQALKESEQRLARIFETIAEGIIMLDRDGHITFANAAAEKILGIPRSDITKRTYYDPTWQISAVDGGPFPESRLPFARTLDTGEPVYDVEFAIQHPTGRRVILSVNAAPLLSAEGALVGVVASLADVTTRRQAEEERRESEERFRSAFDYAAVGMALVAPDGRFLKANRSLCEIVGYPGQELLATDFQAITHPDDLQADVNQMRQMLAGEISTYQMEKRYIHKLGHVVWVLLSVSLVHDAFGRPLYFVSQVQDITERKRLERLRDEFLSTAAHELKTPVATIKGYVQLMRRWEPEQRGPKVVAALDVVNRQCDRINRLIQELLEVSRLQLGLLELHHEKFDLRKLVAEVLTEMQAAAPRHHLLLQRGRSVLVKADRDRIAQVLFNLLDNAVKFSPQGGDVETTVSVRNGEAVVSVEDHGVGIPRERQEHIFERFYRAHAGSLYDYGGMGVGLFISRELVTRHGGKMWFHSEQGKGSTFYFSLPLVERDGDD